MFRQFLRAQLTLLFVFGYLLLTVKKWLGKVGEVGKAGTAANWEGAALPGASSEAEFVGEDNNDCEWNSRTSKAKQLVVATGYTGKWTSTSTAMLTLGTTSSTGVALKLVSGMNFAVAGSMVIRFVGSSGTVETVTTAGKSMCTLEFAGGGSYKLLDALTCSTESLGITLEQGTLDLNGQTVTVPTVKMSGSTERSLKMGGATIVLTNGGNAWAAEKSTSLTLQEAAGSTIELTFFSAEFQGGGLTYGTVRFAPASLGEHHQGIQQSNTFGTLAVNNKGAGAPFGLAVEAGTTQTVTTLTCNGTAEALGRLESSKAGEPWTLSLPAGTKELPLYIALKDVTLAEGTTLYLPNGKDEGGNSANIHFESQTGKKTYEAAIIGSTGTQGVTTGLLVASGAIQTRTGTRPNLTAKLVASASIIGRAGAIANTTAGKLVSAAITSRTGTQATLTAQRVVQASVTTRTGAQAILAGRLVATGMTVSRTGTRSSLHAQFTATATISTRTGAIGVVTLQEAALVFAYAYGGAQLVSPAIGSAAVLVPAAGGASVLIPAVGGVEL
ncbi:MAG TPA: hypothetical protein VGN13_12405 [Solirubrobacteraceae bacterium]